MTDSSSARSNNKSKNGLPKSVLLVHAKLHALGITPEELSDAPSNTRIWTYACPKCNGAAHIEHYPYEVPNSHSDIQCETCKFDGTNPMETLGVTEEDLFDHPADMRSNARLWGPIEPFTGKADELPIDGLPQVLKDLVITTADVIQVPTDMVLTHALGLLSSATFGTVECYCAEGFVTPLNMATVVLADSSARKSPANKVVIKPFRAINERRMQMDAELHRGHAGQIAAQAARVKVAEKNSAAKPKDGATPAWPTNGVEAARDPFETLANEEAELIRLKEDQHGWAAFLGDTTPEALGLKLAHTYTGAALQTADEMDLFDKIKGNGGGPTNTGKANVYLDGLSGSPHVFNRATRSDGYIAQTALSLALMTQPTLFMAHINATPALVDGGLIPRMLVVTPPSLAGSRTGKIKPMPTDVTDAWSDAVTAIAHNAELHVNDELIKRAKAEEEGTPVSASMTIPRRQIKLTEVGLKMFEAYRDKVEVWQGPGGRYEQIKGWAGKSDSHLIAAAANFTLLDNPSAEYVDDGYIAFCERLIDVYGDHMLAIAGVESENNAELLWKKLQTLPSKGEDAEFDAKNYEEDGSISLRSLRRLIQNHSWYKNLPAKGKTEKLREAVETLTARRLVQAREVGKDRLFIMIRPRTLRAS